MVRFFFLSSTTHSVSHWSTAKELFPGPAANALTTGENLSQFSLQSAFAFKFGSSSDDFLSCNSQPNTCLQTTYLNVPHAGGVIQSRVHLAHFLRIFDIPHIQAVVIVYTGKPLVGGVKGQGNGVWILRISHTREKTAAQREKNSLVNLCSPGAGAMLKQESSDSPWGTAEMNKGIYR